MSDPALKLDDRFTYGQYKNWPEDQRWELIDGVAYLMGAPTVKHQRLVGDLYHALRTFLGALAPLR